MSDLATDHKINAELKALEWPPRWRLWVYVSSQVLDEQQMKSMKEAFTQFQAQWSAHGKALRSDMALVQDQILLIAVDEDHAKTTGCSLDKLTHFIGQVELELKTDFLDRSKFYVYDRENEVWRSFNRVRLKQAYQVGEVNDETLVLDTLIDSAGKVKTELVKPLASSWHSKIV